MKNCRDLESSRGIRGVCRVELRYDTSYRGIEKLRTSKCSFQKRGEDRARRGLRVNPLPRDFSFDTRVGSVVNNLLEELSIGN